MFRSFVIEVGVESGEGEFKQWDSDGYYAGYKPDGGPMILVLTHDEAFRFPGKGEAANIPGGDTRIANKYRIVGSHLEPNV